MKKMFASSIPWLFVLFSLNLLIIHSSIQSETNHDKIPRHFHEVSKTPCISNTWISIRSELNHKLLRTFQDQKFVSATSTIDTPLFLKSFELYPVNNSCESGGGWVRLKAGGGSQGFLFQSPNSSIQIGTSDLTNSNFDNRYHFLFEEDGYILNRNSSSYLSVIPQSHFSIQGHDLSSKTAPAGKDLNSKMHFLLVNASHILQSQQQQQNPQHHSLLTPEQLELQEIQSLPSSSLSNKEKRVIAFSLFGSSEKYTGGAIRNAEIAPLYFPGWIPRFYVSPEVPTPVIEKLKSLHSEVFPIPEGLDKPDLGPFWRFLVASDDSVDRFIVRDVDSRLNARERFAVEEWIETGSPVHILRDHPNHCHPFNAGMFGGVKGGLSFMREKILEWVEKGEDHQDQKFLASSIWPLIQDHHYAHDSYCCEKYPNTHPFPRRRPANYQHVGQVFDPQDRPRMNDIDKFLRNRPNPPACRKNPEWIYG